MQSPEFQVQPVTQGRTIFGQKKRKNMGQSQTWIQIIKDGPSLEEKKDRLLQTYHVDCVADSFCVYICSISYNTTSKHTLYLQIMGN